MKNLLNFTQLMGLAMASAGNGARYANAGGEMMIVQPTFGGYTGEGDPAINITGNIQNFAQEGHIDKRFGFSIKNNAATALTARLFSGYNTGSNAAAAGQMTDGAFTDTSGTAGLVATSSDPTHKIAGLQQYLLRNPSRVLQIRMEVSDATQFQNEIVVSMLNPFADNGTRKINPSLLVDGTLFNGKIINLPTDGLQLDDKSDLVYTINAGVTVNMVLFFGASLESSKELAVKAAIGQNNALRY